MVYDYVLSVRSFGNGFESGVGKRMLVYVSVSLFKSFLFSFTFKQSFNTHDQRCERL